MAPRDYPVVQHNSTATPQVMGIELRKADTSTTYTLWEGTEGVARVKILKTVPLQKGDDIGFKFGAGNQVIAIAGNQQIPLPGKYYYWFRDTTFMERCRYGILAPFGSFLTPKGD